MRGSESTWRRQNTWLTGSLVILLLVSVALWWSGNKEISQLDKSLFKLVDPAVINRVVLEREGSKTELTFETGRWRVNGKFDADRSMIDVLFATAAQEEPCRRISPKLQDSVRQYLLQHGVKVTFLEGSASRLSFYAGGDVSQGSALFLDEASQTCYTAVIPGYKVFVSGIYTLPATGWKDRRIFNFNWRNFKELQTQFPRQQSGNFQVLPSEGYFSVDGMKADTARLNEYLDGISLLRADQRIDSASTRSWQSIIAQTPSFLITVKEISGRTHQLTVFPPDPDRADAIGRTGEGDYVIFDKRKIVPLARTKQYFVSSSK